MLASAAAHALVSFEPASRTINDSNVVRFSLWKYPVIAHASVEMVRFARMPCQPSAAGETDAVSGEDVCEVGWSGGSDQTTLADINTASEPLSAGQRCGECSPLARFPQKCQGRTFRAALKFRILNTYCAG